MCACDYLLGGLFCSSTNLPNDLHSLPLSFLIIIQSCSISQVKKKHTQRKGKADNNLVSVVVRLSNSLPLSLYSLSLSTFFLNRVAVIIYFVSLAFTSVCVSAYVWTNCFDGKKETRVGGDFTFPRPTSPFMMNEKLLQKSKKICFGGKREEAHPFFSDIFSFRCEPKMYPHLSLSLFSLCLLLVPSSSLFLRLPTTYYVRKESFVMRFFTFSPTRRRRRRRPFSELASSSCRLLCSLYIYILCIRYVV